MKRLKSPLLRAIEKVGARGKRATRSWKTSALDCPPPTTATRPAKPCAPSSPRRASVERYALVCAISGTLPRSGAKRGGMYGVAPGASERLRA